MSEELITQTPVETEEPINEPIIQGDPIVEIEDDTPFDPLTQKVIQESVYSNNMVQIRTRIIDKSPSEIISDRISTLKLKVAQGIATAEEKEDLRLLILTPTLSY